MRKKFAREIAPCSILNAKSGVCAQNCRFCAQSRHHNTGIETYDLLPAEEVLEAARKAYDTGVRAFGYVTSGYGYKTVTPEFRQILDTLDLLHKELPELKICVSIGILSRETAKLLAEHHAWRYNMTLQTSPTRYAELIADTHTIEDKIAGENMLQGTLKTLFAVAEGYPDLKANTNFLDLQNQLKQLEDDIANSRKYYNAVVKQFNTKCEMFPSNIIASIFHFERKPMFEVESAEERQNVQVKF